MSVFIELTSTNPCFFTQFPISSHQDVYWHPNNITLTRQEDLDVTPTTAIDELRRYDRKWHSDASSGISGGSEPRYPVRRRRRRRKPYQGNLGRLETVNEGEDGIEDEEIKVEPIREIKGKRELKAKVNIVRLSSRVGLSSIVLSFIVLDGLVDEVASRNKYI